MPFLLFFVALALGCSSTPPPKFYTLDDTAAAVPAAGNNPGLRIGAFAFPDYLRRPQIVTRTGTGNIDVAEFDRWAGSLENDFLRLLGARLGAGLATARVSVYPAELGFDPDFVVTGEIAKFDGDLAGTLTLDVNWFVMGPDSEHAVSAKHSAIVETVGGKDYAALVDAHTRAIDRLSAEIEAEIRRLQNGT